MKLLMKKKIPVSGSVKYDPVKFKEYMQKRNKLAPRRIKKIDVIICEIMEHGCSYIPYRDKEAIRGRMRRDGLRWHFTKVNEREVKITPYHD